jgi:ABC-type multidrug transport system fused ATPase/permease subunit
MAPGSGSNPMKENTLMMVYVAIWAFISSACYITTFSVFSESIQYKLKIEYLKACLMKDAAFYDEQNPNEMASKINKETSAVRRGCSEKIGVVNMSIWMFLLGFVAAFYLGWLYSLILLAGLPFIACVGILFGMSMQSGLVQQMKAYAQSAGYAE